MRTLVMKFGGSAVGMTTGLTQLLSIVMNEHEQWPRLLLVISALEGVTDALIEAAHLAELDIRRGYRRVVATLRTRHLALIEHLPLSPSIRSALQADIDNLLFDMLDQCQRLTDRTLSPQQRDETVDGIIGVGEKLAARIVAALLRENDLRGVAIDATDIIITHSPPAPATPDMALTRQRIATVLMPMLERRIIPVVTGFIASTAGGKPTTLGRGGSDYTASVLAASIDADEVWIWTDVNGMMTADPRAHPSAHVLNAMSYDEAAELAYFGARILHARMIGPLREARIPLRVRNVFRPQAPGTLIGGPAAPERGVKAVTAIAALGFSAAHSGPLAGLAALVDDALFTLTGTHAEIAITSQSASASFACFVVPTSAGPDALHPLQQAVNDRLAAQGGGWAVRPMAVVSAIGSALDDPFTATRADLFTRLRGIPIAGFAQSPAGTQMSFAVELADAERAVERIHQFILASEGTPSSG
jgi:aspartate kinase